MCYVGINTIIFNSICLCYFKTFQAVTSDFTFSLRFLKLTYLNSKEENIYAEEPRVRVVIFKKQTFEKKCAKFSKARE